MGGDGLDFLNQDGAAAAAPARAIKNHSQTDGEGAVKLLSPEGVFIYSFTIGFLNMNRLFKNVFEHF